VKAKTEVILRLFRGEAVDAVSREMQVPAHELETWRRAFLEGQMTGLKKRGGDPDRAGVETHASEGRGRKLTMKLELAENAPGKKGYGDGLAIEHPISLDME